MPRFGVTRARKIEGSKNCATAEQGKVIASQAARSCSSSLTSRNLPVSTSKMKPRTGMSLAIQGCDLTFLICSRVFCSGSLKEKKRIGAGEASPVEALSFAFSSSSVKVVNPQPVWLRSSISVVPSTRLEQQVPREHLLLPPVRRFG
jgi:hypothetical protein